MADVDNLINKYAQILKDAKVGDYTYHGILAEFARELKTGDTEPVKPFESIPAELLRGPGTNTGHGHVWSRPDRMKARCGGSAMCRECAADWKEFGYGLRDSS